MKKFSMLMAAVSLSFLCAAKYEVDASHSSVGFEVKHMMVSKVKGDFKKLSGSVDFDGKAIKGLSGEVNIVDINTNNSTRDDHLKAKDFFDAKGFPKATLKMTKFEKGKLYADVKIRNVTKNIAFTAELSGPIKHPKSGKNVISLSLSGEINRKDFKVGSDTPDSQVSDIVGLSIELEAVEK